MNTCATAAGAIGVFLAGWLKRDFGLHTVFAAAAVVYLLNGMALVLGSRFLMPRDLGRARAYGATRAAAAS